MLVIASVAWQSQHYILFFPCHAKKRMKRKVTTAHKSLKNVLPYTKQNKLVRIRTQTEFCLPLRYPPQADARFTNPFFLPTSNL
jgi:hypothetical protein